jgi:hypothetical protein
METYTTILDQARHLVQDDRINGFIREVLSPPACSAAIPVIQFASKYTGGLHETHL